MLWLTSTAAVAFFAALFGAEVLDLEGEAVALLVGLAAAVRWEGGGLVFGLASAAGLLVAGTTSRRLALAVEGIVGVVMFLPATVVYLHGRLLATARCASGCSSAWYGLLSL